MFHVTKYPIKCPFSAQTNGDTQGAVSVTKLISIAKGYPINGKSLIPLRCF